MFPLAYLFYYNLAGVGIYDFPLEFGDAEFAGYLTGFLAAVLAAGYLLYGVGRIRALAVPPAMPNGPPAPLGYPSQPFQPQPWQAPVPPPGPHPGSSGRP